MHFWKYIVRKKHLVSDFAPILTPNSRIFRKKTKQWQCECALGSVEAAHWPSLLHSAASADVAITTREHVRVTHYLLSCGNSVLSIVWMWNNFSAKRPNWYRLIVARYHESTCWFELILKKKTTKKQQHNVVIWDPCPCRCDGFLSNSNGSNSNCTTQI